MIDRRMYKKIVGFCIVMSFMVFALLFYVKDTEATENEIVYAPNYIYTASEYVVNGEKIAPSAPSEISGYLFAGWYTLPEGSKTYTPVAEPKENETYYAKFVPREILGMKAQVTAALIKDEATSKTANSAIRFITTVDSELYKEVGFNITRPGKSTPYDTGNGVVYKELYAVDATRENKGEPDTTYTPDMFHKQSEYFKTWTIGKIPDTYYNSDITVRPYWITLDGTRVDGEIAVKTVNYGRAWYYVDTDAETTNTVAPKGTVSNPYKTLADAVAVETTLNPKLILKSDVTVDATVNIARTITIESFDGAEAKTITYSGDTTKNMLEVAESGNLTLNKLNLNGGNYVVNSTNATFAANNVNIQDGGYYGFRIVGGTANLNNVEITGVDRGVRLESGAIVTGDTLNVVNPAQAISCGGASTFDYNNLTINKSTSNAINVFQNSTVIVNGGEITNARGNGLNVAGAKATTLKGFDITFASDAEGGYGINAYSEEGVVPNVTLVDVNVTGAPKDGISLCDGVTGSYARGTVSGSKGKGIYLYDSKNGANGATLILEDVNIENSTGENLYLNYASSVTVNGTLTMTGGESHSLAIYNVSKVLGGENHSEITINNPQKNGVRLYDDASELNIDVLNVSNSKEQALEVSDSAKATINGGLITVSSSTSGDIFGVKAHNKGVVALNNVEIKNPINSGLVVWSESNVTGSNLRVTQSAQKGVWCADGKSHVNIDGLTLTGCTGDGIRVTNGAIITLSGNVMIDSPKWYGIRCPQGTVEAENAVVTINKPTEYAVRLEGTSEGTIGTLNIDGACTNKTSHSAVRLQDSASLTINGGIIQNSQLHGVNVTGQATLIMNNVTVKNSGLVGGTTTYYDIQKESEGAKITLNDVKYDKGNL